MTDIIGGSSLGTQLLIQGGDVHVRTLLESCLAEAERSRGIPNGVHEALYRESIIASIGHDQLLSAPTTLGLDNEPNARLYDNNFVTRNGEQV